MNKPLLSVINLSKSYKSNPILKNVSLHVEHGQIVGLLGHNGAGKSTCFHSIMGFIQIDSGKILLEEQDISHLSADLRAKKGISYLMQTPSVFPTLTVSDNLMMILEFTTPNKKTRQKKIDHVLELMKIVSFKKRAVETLSGGEKRRLEIARALLINPKILLLDEPFTNVDPKTIQDLKEILLELKDQGISTLLTDHNAKEILSFVDKAFLLDHGSVLASGSADSLIEDRQVIDSYLGKSFAL